MLFPVALCMRDACAELQYAVLVSLLAVRLGIVMGIGVRAVVLFAVIAVGADAHPLVVHVDLPEGHAGNEGKRQQSHDRRSRHDHLGDSPGRNAPVRPGQELDQHEEEPPEHERDRREQAEEIGEAEPVRVCREDGEQPSHDGEDQGRQPRTRPEAVVSDPIVFVVRFRHWDCSVFCATAWLNCNART